MNYMHEKLKQHIGHKICGCVIILAEDYENEENLVKVDKHCKFCGSQLYESTTDGYAYQCLKCEEDFYSFEQE